MPLQKDFMATPLNKNSDDAYTEENLMPVVAGSAASEEAFGGQSQAEDCAAVAGVTFTESPFEKSNSPEAPPSQHGPSRRHAVQTHLRWPFPATESFVRTETSPAIVGAWIASRHSWYGKGWRRDHNNPFHSGSHCRSRLGGDDKGLG
jgi:hypothetical protein